MAENAGLFSLFCFAQNFLINHHPKKINDTLLFLLTTFFLDYDVDAVVPTKLSPCWTLKETTIYSRIGGSCFNRSR